jgi:hypothetical protein
MEWLDRFRRWVWRVEESSNELEYAALDEVHKVEDRLDEATHGRFYDTVEEAGERSSELLQDLHLDDEPGVPGTDEERPSSL